MTENQQIAGSLAEIARLLSHQHQAAAQHRVQGYAHAAQVLDGMDEPVSHILQRTGIAGLTALPGIGNSTAHVIRDIIQHGRSSLLEDLRNGTDPVALFESIPGIGHETARQLHEQLQVSTLEQLEQAAHDGRLANLPNIGPKRLAGIRDCIAQRLEKVG